MTELAFPASSGQHRLWFLDQVNERSAAAYTITARLDLTGPLNVIALQAAINNVVERHESLRTALRGSETGLRQVVSAAARVPLRSIDLSKMDESQRERQLERLLGQESRRLWNLAQAPLLRTLLMRLDGSHHVLLLSVHHAVCDGISLQVLLNELTAAYHLASTNSRDKLPDVPLQFADYVVWSQQQDDHAVLRRQWQEELAGAPLVLDLPTDLRRPAKPSYRGARLPFTLDAPLADRIREYAARTGVTPPAVVLAAFTTVLHRISGVDDLLVGVPVANRDRAELAGVVGYLANICPLRSDMRTEPALGDLVKDLHRRLGGLINRARLPFGDLVDLLSPPRLTDRNPVFQVLFGYQPDASRTVRLGPVEASITDVDNGTARVDLSLFLFEEPAGAVTGFLEYATDLFEQSTISRIADMTMTALHAVLETPEVPAKSVALGGEPSVLDGGHAPVGRLVDRRIRELRTRRAIAVDDGTTTLDFATLNERVDAAAAALQSAGVSPGDHVGVHTGRSVGALVTVLACWRIGAVYLPLDPAAPAQRRAGILAEAKPAVVVSDRPVNVSEIVVPLSELIDAPQAVPTAVDVRPNTVAYTMFTSGSTGRPKGVKVTHGNLAYFLAAVGDRLGLSATDKLLALTTFSFDISLLELLGALVTGGTTVIAPDHVLRDANLLADKLSDPTITVAQATPVTWRMALGAGWRPRPALRVLCGGEALPQDLADALAEAAGTVWNLYGPTETTIWSCAARVTAGRPVVIGGPLPGTDVRIVDEDLRPVPVGICGELLIGGPGVTAGYLDRPELTAERFVEGWYRTGDVMRLRADGDLEFVGRNDQQVKVRGHRIELGEIEAALRGAPGVSDAAVAVRGTGPDAKIVGYVRASRSDAEWVREVRGHVAEILPAGWLPGELVLIDEIPLTPNGKVDRARLSGTPLEASTEYVAPVSEVEKRLCALWCELLGRDKVGVTDDFFLLGGHSLLVAELVERVERELGVRVPITEIFVQPTIRRIAATVEQSRGTPAAGGPADPDEPQDWEFDVIHSAAAS